MAFHLFRPSFWPGKNIFRRLWAYHDRHQTPTWINVYLRYCMFLIRRTAIAGRSRKQEFILGSDKSLTAVSKFDVFVQQPSNNDHLQLSQTERRFNLVHEINECLKSSDGSWVPHSLVEYYSAGVSIEEVALRVRGYLSAYKATGKPACLSLAEGGCNYLLKKRIFENGHIFLKGHTIIDITYAFAGEALFSLWKITGDAPLLSHAIKIGDRLVEYHISGSVNHAVIPVQLLGQLYQVTGDDKYLKNVSKRLFRSAIPLQLPYGGWLGHESWIWYHALILRSLVIGYAAMPATLEYFNKKDRLAMSIIAAVNRLLISQLSDGSFPIRPPAPLCESTKDQKYVAQKALFTSAKTFNVINDSSLLYGSWNGYVIDALLTAYELLDIREIIPCLNRYGNNICNSDYVWRLEFDTLGAGRLLEYTHVVLNEKKALE